MSDPGPRSCTCAIARSLGPDPIDDAEQDPLCPRHYDREFALGLVAERDAMKALLAEARAELTHHGWGDFHYGPQPQDASVVAIITKIDQLVAEGGGAE